MKQVIHYFRKCRLYKCPVNRLSPNDLDYIFTWFMIVSAYRKHAHSHLLGWECIEAVCSLQALKQDLKV